MRTTRLPSLVRLFLAVFFATLTAPARAEPTVPAEWTVLIFMNGKNNLESFALENYAALARVGSTNKVNFIVEMGRPARRPGVQIHMREKAGGWSGVRRYRVTKNATVDPGRELEIVGDSSVDMGSPVVLQEFLRWGKAHYPARKFALVVWNHGQGYRMTFANDGRAQVAVQPRRANDPNLPPSHRAVSQDADTGSIIYNTDLRYAISGGFGSGLRVIGFDACLMAMTETAYELKHQASYLVASEELEPGQGWNYTKLATALVKAPDIEGSDFAKVVVASYRENYGDNDSTTMSAIDLSQMASLATEISKLSGLLLDDQGTTFPLVKAARATLMAYNDPVDPVSIDLIGFLIALDREAASVPRSVELRAQIARTIRSARSAVVANYASALRDSSANYGSSGLAIYFPATIEVFNEDSWSDGYVRSNRFKPIGFVQSERWSEFLAAYLKLPG